MIYIFTMFSFPRPLILALAFTLPSLSSATIWQYAWTNSEPLFGDNNGGIWSSVSFTQDDSTGILDASITLDTSLNFTESLWLSVTNGPTPDSASADYAGIYLHGGRMIVRPYDTSPVNDHELTNIILDSSYSSVDVGSMRTFSFSLDTNSVNTWLGGGAGWKGIGFPYDANHDVGGDVFTPYRMGAWIRSFADNSVTISPSALLGSEGLWDVTWGSESDPNIGTWDIGNTQVTAVPEPSSALLAGLAALIMIGRVRRRW